MELSLHPIQSVIPSWPSSYNPECDPKLAVHGKPAYVEGSAYSTTWPIYIILFAVPELGAHVCVLRSV